MNRHYAKSRALTSRYFSIIVVAAKDLKGVADQEHHFLLKWIFPIMLKDSIHQPEIVLFPGRTCAGKRTSRSSRRNKNIKTQIRNFQMLTYIKHLVGNGKINFIFKLIY